MIIPTVLGCVAAIFAWILQYQNGGLLNVFMKPVRSSDSPNVTFDVVSDFSGIRTQIMNIVWGRLTKADLAVLEALPPDLGGGEAGVAEAIAHPNNEGKLIVAFIACLVFASLGLVVIFIFSFICCICCCCCDSGCHHDEDEDEKDELGSKASTKDQNFICCGLHILALVVTTLLLIGLAVCIGYYFGAANVLSETMADSKAKDVEVVSWLEGNSSSFSVGRILQFFVSNALKFSKSSISSAKTNINVTVSTVKTTILKTALPEEISTLMQTFMTQFKVADIEDAVNSMVYALANVNKNSEYISTNYNSTVGMVTKNSVGLNKALNNIGENCPVKKSEADALKNGFQSRNIPEMQLLRLEDQKLRDLKSKLDTVKTQLKGMQTRILPELGNNLNLERMLDGVNKLTGDLENQFDQISIEMKKINKTVSGYIKEYSGPVYAALYALSLPCILAGAFFLLFLVLFMFEAIRRHLFSIKGKSASQGRGACKSTSRFCWGGIFCVCSGLLLVPIILLGLVGVVTVTVGGFMHAEVCPYIANSRGMRMSDYVANLKVRDVWDNVVLPQLSGGETNDFADFLNLKAPQNPLQAILIGCDPQNGEPTSKSGLLAQMGIGNLVNISAFLQKSRLTEGINQAKKNLVDNIANANLGNEFQDDMITKLKNIIQAFQQMLKSLDLPKSINHLQISVFKTAAIESFAKNLPFNCNAQKDDLLALVRNLNESNAAMNELRSAFEGLNGNATALNSSKLEADITSLKMATANPNAVNNTLAGPLDAFETALLGSVSKIGMEAFASMTQSLLPCDSLHYAIKSVVFMGCGASGLAPRIFAWGLFLSLCLFFTFFSLLSLCLLWRVQNHQARRFAI